MGKKNFFDEKNEKQIINDAKLLKSIIEKILKEETNSKIIASSLKLKPTNKNSKNENTLATNIGDQQELNKLAKRQNRDLQRYRRKTNPTEINENIRNFLEEQKSYLEKLIQ